MSTETTTPLGQYLIRRQAAADRYTESSSPVTAWNDRTAFFAGWNKAVEEIGLMLQTPGADGRFCVHHDDDPAHTKDCYDLISYLTV